jgi:hypothetical protein
MTASTTASPAAAAPAAAATLPTHVTQQQPTGYQPSTPAVADPAAASAQPVGGVTTAADANNPAKQQPAVETKVDDPAKIAAADPAKGADPAQPEFKLPDEYKDKAWAGKIKSQDDLYKQIDTLTALVGKKVVVPNLKEATPEDREAFYAQMRGKDAAEYAIPANPAFPTPPETQPAVAKLFMDNGVSPVQAEAIIKGYQELGAKQIAQNFDPEGFKTSMTTAFGNDWEKVTGAVRNTITAMMSPEDAKQLDSIPNHLLGTVYRTLGNTIKAVDETLKKYGATETFAHLQAPNGKVAATDLVSQRAGLREQMTALSMRPHTSDEMQTLIKALDETYVRDPRLTQQG